MKILDGHDMVRFVNDKMKREEREHKNDTVLKHRRAVTMLPIDNFNIKQPVIALGLPDPGMIVGVGFSERKREVIAQDAPPDYVPQLVAVVEPGAPIHRHEFVFVAAGHTCAEEFPLTYVLSTPSPWGYLVLFERELPEELRAPPERKS